MWQLYQWKFGAKVENCQRLQIKIERGFTLPDCFGLGDFGRWRWRWTPLFLGAGLEFESLRGSNHEYASFSHCDFTPYVHMRSLTPVLRKFAVQPVLEVSLKPSFKIQRKFSIDNATLVLQAHMELGKFCGYPQCGIKIEWLPKKTTKIACKLESKSFTFQYSQGCNVSDNTKVVISAVAQNNFAFPFPKISESHIVWVAKVSQSRAVMGAALSPSTQETPSKRSRKHHIISITPGHWIDPGCETGAPGEREFNYEVANIVEKRLCASGWDVLRPDRDAPNLLWEDYLNWVLRQTKKGVPVLEIHGQGSAAGLGGLVMGVIGDTGNPLSKELAREFGFFGMDWRELGISRCGGVVLESFNADEVLQMSPQDRSVAKRQIAEQIVRCIERSKSRNFEDGS